MTVVSDVCLSWVLCIGRVFGLWVRVCMGLGCGSDFWWMYLAFS